MGSSNGANSGSLKRKQLSRWRRRDELPSLGIVARRLAFRSDTSRQNRSAGASGYSTNYGRRIGINVPVNKYANRRTSFFKFNRPQKAPNRKTGLRCYDALWDKDQRLFRTGDIISIIDEDDDLTYFAQIRALLSNHFGERFAAITWLVPTESAKDAHSFEAEHFIHTLSDSELYPLEVCAFVDHAPALPSYRYEWKPRILSEKKILEELNERVRNVDTISTKLISFDENSKTHEA